MRYPKFLLWSLTATVLLIPVLAVADYMTDWPRIKSYYSSNRSYCFIAAPPHFRSLSAALRSNKKCKGHLYRTTQEGGRKLLWSGTLIHRVSPMSVLVSNDGYAVTIDTWCADESSTMAIYSPEGKLVSRFKLEDILSKASHPPAIIRTVTSIQWGGTHYIDDIKGLLILQIVPPDNSSTFQEVTIDLATGGFIKINNRA